MADGGQSEFEGVVERIVFFNEENHFCIAKIKPTSKELKKETLVTAKGIMPNIECGETVALKGEWDRHQVYGLQMKVAAFESRLPSSVYGIEKFLGSGLIAGIGKEYANRIVKHFGVDTLKIIETESLRLRGVPGIGEKRYKQIRASWEERKSLSEVMIYLQRYGVGIAACLKIVQKYGTDAARIIREEPYRMARDIDGIGFKTADRIALNAGMANESPARIQTGVLYALKEFEDAGDTRVPWGELEARSSQLLEVPLDKCREGMEALLKSEDVKIVCEKSVQSAKLDYAERMLAVHLKKIAQGASVLPPIKHDSALEWAMGRMKFSFASEQSHAILEALKNKVSVITGGPGTGKTTILRALCDILNAKRVRVELAAPTGRAAQRMAESTGMEAKTIHRMLGYEPMKGGFEHDGNNPIAADFVIIDESSMLDTRLAAAVFAAIPATASLVLVGDTDQLPSVGAGNVLKDIIASQSVPVTRLDKIFRQGERSGIVFASHEVLRGVSNIDGVVPTSLDRVDPNNDVNFVIANDPEDCVRACVKLARDLIPQWYAQDAIDASQMLAPMHKGIAGISNFNAVMQQEMNKSHKSIACMGGFFKLGDKVMQTRNNYDLEIFNGDMGRIVEIKSDEYAISVDFDGRKIKLGRSEISELVLAYAISIHKSQGSEFPVVIIPLLRQHFVMLQRNLVYTAISRARRKVFIVGDTGAFASAVRNSRAAERRTALKERLIWH